LPILLLVFQQFSLVSPLANALAIPVVSFVVTPLALLGALVPWWPILALAHQIMAWLMLFLEWCASWPVWLAPAPPWWVAVAAGAGVAVCLLPRGLPGRWLGALLILPALSWPIDRPAEGEAWVDVLDVGQGLASVVRTRNHALIYDPGPLYSAESDAGQRVVVPYLRFLGIDRVDTLMVTHRDTDHSGGTASVRAALAVGEVRSSLPGLGGQLCTAGQRWVWDGVAFEVLHPSTEAYAGTGIGQSSVLRTAGRGWRPTAADDIRYRGAGRSGAPRTLSRPIGGRRHADAAPWFEDLVDAGLPEGGGGDAGGHSGWLSQPFRASEGRGGGPLRSDGDAALAHRPRRRRADRPGRQWRGRVRLAA
jgi:competence protein ComEC